MPHQVFLIIIGSGNKKVKHTTTTHKRSIGIIIFKDFYLVSNGLILCVCQSTHLGIFVLLVSLDLMALILKPNRMIKNIFSCKGAWPRTCHSGAVRVSSLYPNYMSSFDIKCYIKSQSGIYFVVLLSNNTLLLYYQGPLCSPS